ncbi:hypothetical protein B0T26DRAFT_670857 [Lasiosphaeria miniovina]|uniref:Uncharacterized protein n=1 Tax=Lasiosphaeria miniovina TaxID=1954250 RepID=A0AA40BI15_9PEZI|nr:uncharacterized protein B0T26DRAFT_670857 [Lasiosphaeria miniovina]KAK0734575.1 hypothetical protein B0T26DRAFT_670857 [Lasiosphaeria miniovina]
MQETRKCNTIPPSQSRRTFVVTRCKNNAPPRDDYPGVDSYRRRHVPHPEPRLARPASQPAQVAREAVAPILTRGFVQHDDGFDETWDDVASLNVLSALAGQHSDARALLEACSELVADKHTQRQQPAAAPRHARQEGARLDRSTGMGTVEVLSGNDAPDAPDAPDVPDTPDTSGWVTVDMEKQVGKEDRERESGGDKERESGGDKAGEENE